MVGDIGPGPGRHKVGSGTHRQGANQPHSGAPGDLGSPGRRFLTVQLDQVRAQDSGNPVQDLVPGVHGDGADPYAGRPGRLGEPGGRLGFDEPRAGREEVEADETRAGGHCGLDGFQRRQAADLGGNVHGPD